MPYTARLMSALKKSIIVGFAFSFLASLPAAVTFADDPAPCTPPPQSQPGVHWPTGSDASTFVYQCDGQYAGMWTNDHYAYNPDTNTRIALDPTTFTYNPSTGMWDYVSWDYSAAKGIYEPRTLSVSTPPVGATTVGGPKAAAQTSGANPAAQSLAGPSSGGSGIDQTGTFNTTLNNNTGATMSNVILSVAGSGNAGVIGNTTGGSATSGNAQAIANIINLLQSSSNVLGDPNTIMFTANINGDVNGDLLLDPASLGAVQPANISNTLDNNVTVNNSVDASITNNIDLDASTGNANVKTNTTGGNATSGNADAVANIVNILNSAVTAGHSFIGVININGNLNGDILLPPDFVDTLLASNVPHYTVNTSEITNNMTVNNTNNSSINNDVHAGANSGNATGANNTSAGSAITGNANTNLTVFNLTGSTIVASNDLLVFVNVLGTWYGMILNAPAGTTAASIGGGVTTNTINNDATLNNTNNQSINNKVNVKANSGDATVADNTNAGNAKSGDATASVNIMNMINDSLSLNGWFGLLFINVFGTWNGSFGVNTSAGDQVPPPSGGTSGEMFAFIPGGNTNTKWQPTFAGSDGGSTSGNSTDGVVLAAKTIKQTAGAVTPSAIQKATNHYILPALGVAFALLILLAGERGNRLFRSSQTP